jgi:hypothetical protein
MRALAKEPDERYQSCREMFEDLRNYRALGAHDRGPDATLISPRGQLAGQPFSTPTAPFRQQYAEDTPTHAAARALQQRAVTPSQTPTVRRTGPLPPLEDVPPKKSSALATVLAAIFLVGVIVFGVVRLRPEIEAARARNNPSVPPPAVPIARPTPAPDSTVKPAPVDKSTDNSPVPAAPVDAAPTPPPTEDAASAKPTGQPVAAPPAPKKSEPSISPAAAAYKQQIEQTLADKDLADKVKIKVAANLLTFTGKLRPAEHSSLLKLLRDAPSNVRIADDIQYDDTPVAGAESADNGTHPVPAPGKSAIHVVTDVIGATATLFGPAGRHLFDCQTPCSFNNLAPTHYSLQVTKDGFSPLQTALELTAGQVLDQKLHLQATATGLLVTSQPAGADIFINGAKQSGKTPATLPLAQGQYDLVLRMQGYFPYAGHIVVKDNAQTKIDAQLKQKSDEHVAWAQVRTTPEGAEIFIDGAPVGEISPARVQIPTGPHIIAMRLKGYLIAKRGVEASEGGTVQVNETLQPR